MTAAPPESREGMMPVTGGRVWYRIVGPDAPGVPLLVLHGGPGLPHDYLAPLAALADARPVVFYDQLGCGRSERPADPALWTLPRFVAEVRQVRAALGLDRVHLLGHSWGSMLAVDYLLTGPAGVERLILASPLLCSARTRADLDAYRLVLPAGIRTALDQHEAAGTTGSAGYQAATILFYQQHLCRLRPWPTALRQALAGLGQAVYETMWGPSEFFMTGTLVDYDATPRLPEIALPTLLTCGRYDEATPAATAWYAGLLPRAAVAVFEQSAHMPQLEEPDRYVAVVRAFLTGADAAP